jgi:hypothetical protein
MVGPFWLKTDLPPAPWLSFLTQPTHLIGSRWKGQTFWALWVSAQPVTKSEIKLAGHARLMQPSDHTCQNASCRVGGGYFF